MIYSRASIVIGFALLDSITARGGSSSAARLASLCRRGGDVIGIERFGASAPGNVVMEKLGFTVNHVVERALALLEK